MADNDKGKREAVRGLMRDLAPEFTDLPPEMHYDFTDRENPKEPPKGLEAQFDAVEAVRGNIVNREQMRAEDRELARDDDFDR